MRSLLFFFVLLIFGLSSCNSDCKELGQAKIDAEGWHYRDSLEFVLQAVDTTVSYDLVLELEHTTEFSFQNLYVRTNTYFPSGAKIRDVISLDIGDMSGRWNGTCSGNSCIAPVLLRSKFRFSETGTHKIVFEQFSRFSIIQGISKMRLLLCSNNPKESK